MIYNTIAYRYFNSVLKINPGIREVTVSFAVKHQEESKDKHLYSHLTLFSPKVCDFGEEALPQHAEQSKPKRICLFVEHELGLRLETRIVTGGRRKEERKSPLKVILQLWLIA